MKTVIVFGGLGYLGVPLCLHLDALGYTVVCVNRSLSKRANTLTQRGITVMESTVVNSTAIKDYQPHLIINLIHSRQDSQLSHLLENLLKSHQYILDEAVKYSVKAYLFASDLQNGTILHTTKNLMETLATHYQEEHPQMMISSLRLAVILDSEMNPHFNPELFPVAPIGRQTVVELIACLTDGVLKGELPLEPWYTLKGPLEYSIAGNTITKRPTKTHYLLKRQPPVDVVRYLHGVQFQQLKPTNFLHWMIALTIAVLGIYIMCQIKPETF